MNLKSKKRYLTISIICFVCFTINCSTPNTDYVEEEFYFSDPWINEPTNSEILYKYDREYDFDIDFHEVRFEKINESNDLLSEKPALEISLNYAKVLIGKEDIALKNNTKPYLVRALYGYKGTGGFYVESLGRDIWIQHASLGSGRPKLIKQPLVIFLEFCPEIVYVSVSIAM